MNKLQKIAIDNPCLLAVETSHPRFTHDQAWGMVRISVNSGYE